MLHFNEIERPRRSFSVMLSPQRQLPFRPASHHLARKDAPRRLQVHAASRHTEKIHTAYIYQNVCCINISLPIRSGQATPVKVVCSSNALSTLAVALLSTDSPEQPLFCRV